MRAPMTIASLLLILLLAAPPGAQAAPRSWEDILAETAPARAAASAAAAAAAAPASKKTPPAAPVPAVSLELATGEAAVSWDEAKGEYGCSAAAGAPGDTGSSAYCQVNAGKMVALFVQCPPGQAATAPSCYHPILGDSPTVVYGWFVRGPVLACGFTYPPRQDAPYKIGASAYCMTINEFDAPKKQKQKHGRGL